MEIACPKCRGKAEVTVSAIDPADGHVRWGYKSALPANCESPQLSGTACPHLDPVAIGTIREALSS